MEIVVEGEKSGIEKLLALVRTGPPFARVSGAEPTWEEWRGEFTGFRITW